MSNPGCVKRYGRLDDCFEYRPYGPKGEGFYVTDLGRRIGKRLKISVSASRAANERKKWSRRAQPLGRATDKR
jgi:hypothetical protein